MVEKSGDRPKVSITSKGVVSIDAEELFNSPVVQQTLKSMVEIENSHKRLESFQN